MRKFLFFMLAATFMASCQQEEEGTPSVSNNRVTISPIVTRATEVNFENEDVIGLTITKSDETVYANNEAMTFKDGVFSGNVLWYPEGTEESTLTAYYPYASEGTPSSFTVQADQNANKGYEASDFMAANKTNVTPSTSAVTMIFKHMFTKLLLNVENESGSDISSIVLQGSIPTADIDYSTLTTTVNSSTVATDITAQQVTANETYRAIIIPQTVAFNLVVTTADGNTLEQKLASTTLKQGGQYEVSVRILPDDLQVLLSGEIENWTDEGNIPAAPAEVDFEEHLEENYFIYDGETYKTVKLDNGSIWMAEPLRYVPEGYTPSDDPTADAHIWYPYKLIDNDGVINTVSADGAEALTDSESIKKFGYLYDMSIALGGVKITEENIHNYEGVQGICPKGWHIPTRADFYALCGLSNKDDSGTETGNQVNENALFYDEEYQGGKWTKYNDAGWNYVMSGARMKSNKNAAPQYQLTRFYSGNTTAAMLEKYEGTPALTYIMSSTGYVSTNKNLQFFGQMTSFTSKYREGRINVAYYYNECGVQIRCIRDQADN